MTVKQIIYNLRNLIKDKSDDIKISDRQLEYIVNYVRARLIKQEADKGKTLSANIIQDLGIIQLKKVDKAEDNNIKVNSVILKSINKIPKVIELNFKDGFTYIGGVDRESPIQFSTKAGSRWSSYNKYTGNKPHAYSYDGYLYIKGCDKLLKFINVSGIFEDPREASNFYDSDGLSCYDPDVDDYPISSWMIQPLTELIITKELNTFFKAPEDIRNDASDQIRTQ